MATGFPVGFVGPLPIDGFYDPSLTSAEHSTSASDTSATAFGGPVPVGGIYSNHDAPTLGTVLVPQLPFDPYGTVTFTTSAGQFIKLIGNQNGVSSSFASTVTITGDAAEVSRQINHVLVTVPPNHQGNITITQSWTNPTPSSRNIVVPVSRYDDGSYKATLQDLKTLESTSSATTIATAPAAVAPLLAPTGVRDGIDWNTLTLLGPGHGDSTDPGTGKTYRTTGKIWQVKTVNGSTLQLLEADPRDQQPPATKALPTFQDPSFNCHGFTFGAVGVVCPDGVTRSFQIPQDADAKAILAEKYTQITIDQAFNIRNNPADTRKLIFVFWKDGKAQHSAVNIPGQPFVRTKLFGQTIGIGDDTRVSSKNGDQNFWPNAKIKIVYQAYPGMDVKIYVAKP